MAKRIVIEDDIYKKILHYARKDESWSQTLERLYNDAECKNKIWRPITYPINPNPFTDPYYRGPTLQCEGELMK